MAIHHTAAFVFVIIIGCNLVLYPSLFSKLFRQWFGGAEVKPKARNPLEDVPPPMRGRPPSFQGPAGVQHRQHAERSPFPSSTKVQEPGFKGIMGTVLPVYAVGIMIYFVFVIYKVFLKEKPSKNTLKDRFRDPYNTSSMNRRLREEEEALQKRLSEELRKHGYGNMNSTNSKTPSEKDTSANSHSDEEVAVLQKRLEQTERTMAKMLEMMNKMGISVSEMSSHLENNSEETGPSVDIVEDGYDDEGNEDGYGDEGEEGDEDVGQYVEDGECYDASDASSKEEYNPDDEEEGDNNEDESEPALNEVEDIGAYEQNEEDTVRRRKVTVNQE